MFQTVWHHAVIGICKMSKYGLEYSCRCNINNSLMDRQPSIRYGDLTLSCCKCYRNSVGIHNILELPWDPRGAISGFGWRLSSNNISNYEFHDVEVLSIFDAKLYFSEASPYVYMLQTRSSMLAYHWVVFTEQVRSNFLDYKWQSGAIITRSNLSRYFTQHCNYSSRTWIGLETHNRHTIPRPSGRARGAGGSFVEILDKIDRVITAPHCMSKFVRCSVIICIFQDDSTRYHSASGILLFQIVVRQNVDLCFGVVMSIQRPYKFIVHWLTHWFLGELGVILTISYSNALKWISQDLTDGESTLVHVGAWCNGQQAIIWTNVDQCWSHPKACLSGTTWRSQKSFSPSWASYQIRKIAGCACAGNAGNVFPATSG